MKKHIKAIVVIVIVLVVICVAFPIIGTSEGKLEAAARKSQEIDDSWQVSKSVSDKAAAMIFYDENSEDYTFSTYLNKDGLSFGYFFRAGGKNDEITKGVAGFNYVNGGEVLISMNKVKVARIEVTRGKGEKAEVLQSWDIDPNKPFAVSITPVEENNNDLFLSIYDKAGNPISQSSFAVN